MEDKLEKGNINSPQIILQKLIESTPATGSLATLGTVNLGKSDRGVVGKQSGGCLLKFRLKTLAVAAPRQISELSEIRELE